MTDTYSTQFLLLFSQIVHELCIVEPSAENFEPVLTKLNNHPIVNNSLSLDSQSLCDLYSEMLQENDISVEDVGQGVLGKKSPEFATKLCEIYYFERIEELKQGIQQDSELFNEQLSQLEAET